ncbi:MAG TPA: Uma2 family endonuclease [Gemmatimonadales bacterium]|nr:Uma2 family endonuclease [Gemmatimonadales bacterium]
MAASTYYSAEMVRALPEDGKRYETVHGELLVTPSPRLPHQYVVTELTVRIANYLSAHPVGRVLISPADISWGREDVLVQPDLFVVSREEARTNDWAQLRTLLLAVEVLSPSTGRADRFTKRRLYQEFGVPTYWIIDIEARAAEVWTPDATFPTVERERLVWHPGGARDALAIELSDLLPTR